MSLNSKQPHEKTGYTKMQNDIYDYALVNLSDSEYKLLGFFIRHTIGWNGKYANSEGLEVSGREIAELLGKSLATVQKGIKSLKSHGLLESTDRRGKPSIYRVLNPDLTGCTKIQFTPDLKNRSPEAMSSNVINDSLNQEQNPRCTKKQVTSDLKNRSPSAPQALSANENQVPKEKERNIKKEEERKKNTSSSKIELEEKDIKANPPLPPKKNTSSLLGKQRNELSCSMPDKEKEKSCAKKEKESQEELDSDAKEFFKAYFKRGFKQYEDICPIWFESFGRDKRMLRKVATSEVPSLSMRPKFQERPEFARENALAHLLNNPNESKILSEFLKRRDRLMSPKVAKFEVGQDVLIAGKVATIKAKDDDMWFTVAYRDGVEKKVNRNVLGIANTSNHSIDLTKIGVNNATVHT